MRLCTVWSLRSRSRVIVQAGLPYNMLGVIKMCRISLKTRTDLYRSLFRMSKHPEFIRICGNPGIRKQAGGEPEGPETSRDLADRLTLFKEEEGEHFLPLILLPALPDSKSNLHLWQVKSKSTL